MDITPALAPRPSGNNEGGSSDEEDEDEEEASTSSHPQREDASASDSSALHEKTPIALIDYILNVVSPLYWLCTYAYLTRVILQVHGLKFGFFKSMQTFETHFH
jgi:hypothetical protein